jgi:hypothetical protein
VHGLARRLGHVIRLKLARGQAACPQRPVPQRVDVEAEEPARADQPPDLREHARVTSSGNMCRATFDMTASKLPSGKGSGRVTSATRKLASDPNLACACPIASPDTSTAVTE